MAVNSSEEGQDAYSVAVLPDESTTVPLCESQSFLSLLKVPEPLKHSISLDVILNSQNKVNREMENADVYFPCFADTDIEKGKSETPKTKDEPIGNLKFEDPLTHFAEGTAETDKHTDGREFHAAVNGPQRCIAEIQFQRYIESSSTTTIWLLYYRNSISEINLLSREFMTRQIPGRGNISGLPRSIQEKLYSCSQSCRVWEQ